MAALYKTKPFKKKYNSSISSLGFTMMELLVVMGITVILMSIIMVPLISSFRMVGLAQGEAGMQSLTQTLLERIAKEISLSAGVLDSSGDISIYVPQEPDRPLDQVPLPLENARIDFFMPAREGRTTQSENSRGIYNEDIGRVDPTLHAPRGDVILPVTPGMTMVRYFVGLKEPLKEVRGSGGQSQYEQGKYRNPHRSPLMQSYQGHENLYVLYRTEVQPYIFDRGRWRPNAEFFKIQGDRPEIDDREFFVLHPSESSDREKTKRILAWKKRSRIVTELSRYDMIVPMLQARSNKLLRDEWNFPRVRSLIEFRLDGVRDELAKMAPINQLGQEGKDADRYGAESCWSKYGSWNKACIKIYPRSEGEKDFSGAVPLLTTSQEFELQDPWLGMLYSLSSVSDPSSSVPVFSFQAYQDPRARFPFSEATQWNRLSEGTSFVPFSVNKTKGKIDFSFPITEVGGRPMQGSRALGSSARHTDNRPVFQVKKCDQEDVFGKSFQALAADIQDPDTEINRRFLDLWYLEKAYADLRLKKSLRPEVGYLARLFRVGRLQYAKRFIELAYALGKDGTPSPLHPDYRLKRAKILPGSEIVIGPDQLAPEGIFREVRYTRVSHRPVGPNQYLINYVNQPQPDHLVDQVFHETPLSDEQKETLLESIFLPRFQVGYLEFDSTLDRSLPEGEISVFYRFYFTEPGDIVSLDYNTNRIVSIHLGLSHYPSGSPPKPQQMSLTRVASVKNYLR